MKMTASLTSLNVFGMEMMGKLFGIVHCMVEHCLTVEGMHGEKDLK